MRFTSGSALSSAVALGLLCSSSASALVQPHANRQERFDAAAAVADAGASAGSFGIGSLEHSIEGLIKNVLHSDAGVSQDDPLAGMLSGAGASASPRIELPLEREEMSAAQAGQTIEQMIVSMAKKSGSEHVTLSHKDFPELSVRIKRIAAGDKSKVSALAQGLRSNDDDKSDPQAFCDPTVTSYSGYIDLANGASLFFYFFESRSNPSKDPVLFWTNGGEFSARKLEQPPSSLLHADVRICAGPGCSSSLGLFQEHGPCLIELGSSKHSQGPPINGTKWNPDSWNARTNTLYVEQPAGVGYSYGRLGHRVGDTDTAARDIYAFLRVFFAAFDQYRDNGLILASESYGGRYMGLFATELIDHNMAYKEAALRKGKKPKRDDIIKLHSVMIGNGLTDIAKQYPAYYDFVCTKAGGFDPLLPISTCTRMKVYRERCRQDLTAYCHEDYNANRCREAMNTCNTELMAPYFQTQRNPYNVDDLCLAGLSPNLCYEVSEDIRAYLDRTDVRKLVGAAPISQIGKYKSCNNDVAQDFTWHQDHTLDNTRNIALLLEHSIPVLIYVGDRDWICNALGNWNWVKDLEWTGREDFHAHKMRRWVVDGKDAGETQHGGGLTWATVAGAGHMVPADKGPEAQAMLHRWLDGEPL